MSEAVTEATTMTGSQHIDLVESWAAHNYHPLPVVIERAEERLKRRKDKEAGIERVVKSLCQLGRG